MRKMAALVRDIIIGCSPISDPGISPPIPRIIIGLRSGDGLGCGEVPGAFCACAIDPVNATAALVSKNFRICFLLRSGFERLGGGCRPAPGDAVLARHEGRPDSVGPTICDATDRRLLRRFGLR
jgi:hypothetical protein